MPAKAGVNVYGPLAERGTVSAKLSPVYTGELVPPGQTALPLLVGPARADRLSRTRSQ